MLIEPDLGAHDGARVRAHAAWSWRAAAKRRSRHARAARSRWRCHADDYAALSSPRARVPAQPPTCRSPSCGRANARRTEAARIAAVFGDLAGKPLDPPELQTTRQSRIRLDRYESVDYRLVRAGDADAASRSTCGASRGARHSCVSVSASRATTTAASRANAAAQLLMTDLNALDADWTIEAQIGEEPRLLHGVLPAAVVAQRLVHRTELPLRAEDAAGRRRRSTASRATASATPSVALAIGAELSNWGEVRARRAARRRQHARADRRSDVARPRLRPRRRVRAVRLRPARQRLFPEAGPGVPGDAGWRIASRSVPRTTPTSCRPRGNSRAARDRYSLVLVDGRRLGARRPRELAAGPVHARRLSRAVRAAVATRSSARSTASRARSSIGASAAAARDSSSIPRTWASRSRPATSGRRATTSISATSRWAAACSWVRTARSGRSTSRPASPSGGERRSTCSWARRSEPARRRRAFRLECRLAWRSDRDDALPTPRTCASRCRRSATVRPARARAPATTRCATSSATTGRRSTGLRRAPSATRRWREMSGRYVYFRPGDAPTLDFETIDP